MLRIQGASDGTHIIYLEKDFGGYFHFLIEIIPFIVSVGKQLSVRVSVSPELNAKYDFIVSVLMETRIPFVLGVAQNGRDLRVKDLVHTSKLAYYYPNLASVQILRQALKAKERHDIQGHRRRLFLSRRDNEGTQGRVLANQIEIAAILDSMGFTPYYAEDYTFDQQRNDFSAAEIVVGVHGAGLSNVVFMDRGATVVELMPKTEFKWHFALLASYCQINYVLLPIDTLDTINGGRPKRVLANQAELAKCVRQQIDALGSERHTEL
jgi:capsular polysaccharide biosynthesis protein